MKIIFKYQIFPITLGELKLIKLPKDSKILHFNEQNGGFFIWVEHDKHPDPDEFEEFEFILTWTGLEFPEGFKFIGTHVGYALVHHLYYRIKS